MTDETTRDETMPPEAMPDETIHPTATDAIAPAKRPRRTGLIVMWVVFALLLIGAGGVAAVFLVAQDGAVRARQEQVAELEQANSDLSKKKTELTYASTTRDRARVRYEREALRSERDRECVAYIQGKLREMRRVNHIEIDHGMCVE
jgi:uncharacterized protein (DUF3084 family)